MEMGGTAHGYYYVTATDFAGNEGGAASIEGETEDVPEAQILPASLALHPSRPNPFNPITVIPYDLPSNMPVQLRIYDPTGRLVRQLVKEDMHRPGSHWIEWDGRDMNGHRVGSGAYLCRLDAGGISKTTSMVMLK